MGKPPDLNQPANSSSLHIMAMMQLAGKWFASLNGIAIAVIISMAINLLGVAIAGLAGKDGPDCVVVTAASRLMIAACYSLVWPALGAIGGIVAANWPTWVNVYETLPVPIGADDPSPSVMTRKRAKSIVQVQGGALALAFACILVTAFDAYKHYHDITPEDLFAWRVGVATECKGPLGTLAAPPAASAPKVDAPTAPPAASVPKVDAPTAPPAASPAAPAPQTTDRPAK
jgi:hypothetical protein